MKTLNWGTVPEDLTIDEPYPMELNQEDEAVFCSIVNQGIDSHLEAVHAQDRGIVKGHPTLRAFDKHAISIEDSASMRTFLRRCVESDDERAQDLASCIMSTLGYEWI